MVTKTLKSSRLGSRKAVQFSREPRQESGSLPGAGLLHWGGASSLELLVTYFVLLWALSVLPLQKTLTKGQGQRSSAKERLAAGFHRLSILLDRTLSRYWTQRDSFWWESAREYCILHHMKESSPENFKTFKMKLFSLIKNRITKS